MSHEKPDIAKMRQEWVDIKSRYSRSGARNLFLDLSLDELRILEPKARAVLTQNMELSSYIRNRHGSMLRKPYRISAEILDYTAEYLDDLHDIKRMHEDIWSAFYDKGGRYP